MTKYGELKKIGKCVGCMNTNDTPEYAYCSKCREYRKKYDKDTKEWYLSHGICYRCRKYDVLPGRKMCHECEAYYANRNTNKNTDSKKHNLTNKARYEYRKANGLCTKCGGKIGSSKSTIMCNECYQKHRRVHYKMYWSKVEIPRKKRPEYGLCFICGNSYEPNGFKVCDKCREVQRQAAILEDKSKWLEWQRNENKRVRTKIRR